MNEISLCNRFSTEISYIHRCCFPEHCFPALQELLIYCQLLWVLSHDGTGGNDLAEQLARGP